MSSAAIRLVEIQEYFSVLLRQLLDYNENSLRTAAYRNIWLMELRKKCKIVKIIPFDFVLYANVEKTGARGSVVGSGTTLQVGRSRV
jgi:hypothetical protein